MKLEKRSDYFYGGLNSLSYSVFTRIEYQVSLSGCDNVPFNLMFIQEVWTGASPTRLTPQDKG